MEAQCRSIIPSSGWVRNTISPWWNKASVGRSQFSAFYSYFYDYLDNSSDVFQYLFSSPSAHFQCPSPLWYCSFVRSCTGLWIKSIPKERHFDILKCYQQESVTTVPAQREMLLAMPLVLIYNSFLSFHSFQAQTDIFIRSSLCWHASCWSWYTQWMQELCQSCDPSINTTPASTDWCELKTPQNVWTM